MSQTRTQLVLVGAGGFFLEVYDYLRSGLCHDAQPVEIKGFLDKQAIDSNRGVEYLGAVTDYAVQPDDRFLICIGNPFTRERLYEDLKSRGAQFYTLIHKTALISPSAQLAEGVIVCPFSIVNAEARVAANVCLNVNTSVGHEASIGQSCSLSPYAAVNGNARLGKLCFMGTRATVFPGISVGDKTTIDSHSYVKQNTGEAKIVSNVGPLTSVDNRFIR